MRACVIFNPSARGQKAQKLSGLLQSFALDCDCQPTSAAGDARLFAAQAVQKGFDTIIAAGGDGTLNEVLNGIGDVPGGFSKVRLGVLPLGTINVFARELGIPLDLKQAWEIILLGNEILIDLPKAEFQRQGKPALQYFAQLAGAGLDSNAVAMVDWELKKKIGPLAYIVAGVKALQLPQSKITVSSTNGSATGELALIGNGRFYGGNFALCPKADLRDGLLDVCVFPKVDWPTLFRAGIGLMTKNLHRVCATRELQADTFTLTAGRQTFLQLDGENVGELPAKFSVQPKILRVIAPRTGLTA
jgi:YegS/Rv2252/BmrU family lipid kinase